MKTYYWKYIKNNAYKSHLILKDHKNGLHVLNFNVNYQNNKINLVHFIYGSHALVGKLKTLKLLNSNNVFIFPKEIYFIEDRIEFLKQELTVALLSLGIFCVNKNQLNFI